MKVKKIVLLTTFLLGFVLPEVMSTPETDSLFNRLSNAKIAEKPALLNQIAQSYIPGEAKTGLQYALQAVDLSKQSKNRKQEALGYKIAGAAYYNLFDFDKSLNAYENAIQLFQLSDDKNQIASVYLNIGLVYRDQNEYNNAHQSFKKALDIYVSIHNSQGQANTYNYLGALSWKQGIRDMTIEYYEKALQLRIQLNNPSDIATAYNRLAFAYKEAFFIDKSLENYTQALQFYTKSGNKKLLAANLNDIGSLYWKENNYEKALEFYFKSIKIRYELDDQTGIADSYINIGNIFKNLENYQKAKEYYHLSLKLYSQTVQEPKLANTLTLLGNIETLLDNKAEALDFYSRALIIRRKMGDKKEIALSLNNIGNILSELNEPSKALKNFQECLAIRNEIKDIPGKIITLNDMGNLYDNTNSLPLAAEYFTQSLNLAQQSKNHYYTSLCSRKLAEIGLKTEQTDKTIIDYLHQALQAGEKANNAELIKNAEFTFYLFFTKNKNFEKALHHYIVSGALNDSLKNSKNSRRLMGLQNNIELEKKNNELKAFENEVKYLRQEKELQETQITKQKYQRNGLLLISFLTVITALLFIRLYLDKKRTNQKLNHKNKLIQEVNAQLITRENELKILNSTKDKYFSVIAHDIKNPLSALMNLSHIIIEKFDTLKPAEIQEFNKMIYESADNLHTLLENLLYWARSNTNKIKYHPENIKVKPIVNNILLINKLSAKQKNIEIVSSVDNFEVFADVQMLTSILRNLVSNAIKFTREGGKIEINAINAGRMIEIAVSDNGVGMQPDDVEKLFRLDTHFSGRGTNNEVGTGLGLILVKEFVEKNQGKISVWSEPGKGSTFTFSVPNSTW